jgi:hypothetical protein
VFPRRGRLAEAADQRGLADARLAPDQGEAAKASRGLTQPTVENFQMVFSLQ